MNWQYWITGLIGAAVFAAVVFRVVRFIKGANDPCRGCDCGCGCEPEGCKINSELQAEKYERLRQ